jgi:hypothetical protein
MAGGLLALALLAGCTDNPVDTGPVPGHLKVEWTVPGAAEGALVLNLTGPGELEVEGAQGRLVHARKMGGGVRVAVFGEIPAGELFRFAVPDVRRADSYAAKLVEVSGTDNQLRGTLSAYAVTITPVQ